ncbi:hypothetical protein H4S07_005995 [Coemansia furcata]|uniref:Uncharacterized protein n=1 Tax=Coemansia furcata TaxID=417177 RepID=A0ACC1KYC2_9FUNG|nr:hypothetical protein H4S07_005995 [Coemansia furcata]
MKGDTKMIKHWSRQLSGTDLYILFSTILTGQNWSAIEGKSLAKSTAPAHFSVGSMMKEHPDILRQITDVLSSVPPVLLLVLKTNDLLRMVDQKLFADQPLAVQQHAQLRTWMRISHYCLIAIRNARSQDIHHSVSRAGFLQTASRIGRLAMNWISFWVYDAALTLYSVVLTIEDVFIRWRAKFAH